MKQWTKTRLALSLLIVVSTALGVRSAEPTRYVIVVTGAELLSGVYPDGHTYFITRTLRPLGLRCVGSMSVDDKKGDLKEALRFAATKAPLIIVTGGLGPTPNDITRETLSEFTSIPLAEHPEVLKNMTRRFGVSPERLRANLRRQTQVPTRGTYLKNANGTAVGLVFEQAETVIVALPGPPRELQTMVRDELVPYLSRRFGTRLPGRSLKLRFVGLGQSQIDQTLKEYVTIASDIVVSSQFDGSRVDYTFSLPGDTPRDQTRLEKLKGEILKHLGDSVYADDETSLEQRVVELLAECNATLSVAEVGSGGSLTAALSGAGGAHRVMAGGCVAPTAEKLRRMLGIRRDYNEKSPGKETEQLAEAAAAATASQWALAVGEPFKDDRGTEYVNIAFKLPDGRLESRRLRFRGTGELARARLSTQLLDQLRRRLK
ncbi:MAG: molybdopterin-binding protein [Planctomycetota bacterium]|jgi:nicotinamide-nucleotide amidase